MLSVSVFGGLTLLAAAQSIGGPVLGFIPDAGGTVIRPVFGIPGASVLGNRLTLDAGIRGAIISPKQDYAIASRAADAQTVVIDVAADPPVVTPVTGTHPGAELITVSPTGSAAAEYDRASETIQVIAGLPHSAAVVAEFDTSLIPGSATGLTISDDGTIALIKVVDSGGVGLWVVGSASGPWRISVDRPSATAFFPNRHDAVVTDHATHSAFLVVDPPSDTAFFPNRRDPVGNAHATHSAFLVMDIDKAGTLVPLLSATDGAETFSSVSVAEDGQRVFLADAPSGVITTLDLKTGTRTQMSCQCRPTGLDRLSGKSIFRLTERSGEPIMVLDASSNDPRIGIIPPAVPPAALQPLSERFSSRSQ